MKRIIFLTFLILGFIGIILAYTAPNFIDWNQHKNYIIKEISQSPDIKIKHAESVKVTLIPANIIIKKAEIQYNQYNNIYAEELNITPKISNLLLGHIKIKSIQVIRATLPLSIVTNLANIRNYTLSILNSSLDLDNGHTLEKMDLTIEKDSIKGSVYILDQYTNFNINLSKIIDDKQAFKGKLSQGDISTDISGNIYLIDHKINKTDGDFNSSVKSNNTNTQLKGSIIIQDNILSLTNTKFINDLIEVGLDVQYDINKNMMKGNVLVENLDLNPIIDYEINKIIKTQNQTEQYYGRNLYNIISNIKDFDVDLTVKQVKIYEDTIYNQSFKLNSNSQAAIKVAMQDLKLPNNSKLSFSADIKNIDSKYIIDSQIKLESQKSSDFLKWLLKDKYNALFSDLNLEYPFILSANLYLYDKGIALNNIQCMLDNTHISGYSLLHKDNLYSTNLHIRNFNTDKFKISEKIWPFINYMMPFSQEDSFIYDLLNLTRRYHVSLSFDNATINSHHINNMNVIFKLEEGIVNLKQLAFNTDKQQWNLVSEINTNQLTPSFSMKLNGPSLDLQELKNIVFNKDIQPQLIDNFLSTPLDWLARYKYDISATFNNVILDKDFTFDKFETAFKTTDNKYIVLDKLNFNFLGGTFNSNGNLYFSPISLNIAFAHNNSPLNPIMQLFIPDTQLSGYYSISGALASSNFTNFQDLTKNLAASTSFAIRDGKILMYDVDYVAEKLANKQFDSHFVKEVNNIMSNAKKQLINYASIDGNLNLDKNIITLSNVTAYSQYTTSNMAGSIDLLNKQINAASKYSFSFGNSDKTPGEFSIKFTGTLDNITENVDNNTLLETINKFVMQPTIKQQ